MHAFVEHLSGLVRIGPLALSYGKDWEFIVAYASVDGETAVMKGLKRLDHKFTIHHRTAAARALAGAGFSRATWQRHKHGRVRPVTVDLRKYRA